MTKLVAEIDHLIRANRLRDAGVALHAAIPPDLSDLRDEVSIWLARLAQADSQHRVEDLSAAEYAKARAKLARQLLELRRVLADSAVAVTETRTPETARSVFLSYNHADATDASAVRDALQCNGIAVRMDADSMKPGTDVRGFILNSIRATHATVCIVSECSLLSGWVGQETALTLTSLELWGNRQFVACYLDISFLDAGFRLRATETIDTRLAELESLLPSYAERRIDTTDLSAEKSRLFDLRNQLGAILQRLRGSLCLDIRPPSRAASLERLAAALREEGGGWA